MSAALQRINPTSDNDGRIDVTLVPHVIENHRRVAAGGGGDFLNDLPVLVVVEVGGDGGIVVQGS